MLNEVREERDKHFTTAHFRAMDREALDKAMHQYLLEYHPAGYATRLKVSPHPLPDGDWVGTLERYTSCE